MGSLYCSLSPSIYASDTQQHINVIIKPDYNVGLGTEDNPHELQLDKDNGNRLSNILPGTTVKLDLSNVIGGEGVTVKVNDTTIQEVRTNFQLTNIFDVVLTYNNQYTLCIANHYTSNDDYFKQSWEIPDLSSIPSTLELEANEIKSIILPDNIVLCDHDDCKTTLTASDATIVEVVQDANNKKKWDIKGLKSGSTTLTLATGSVTNKTIEINISAPQDTKPEPSNPTEINYLETKVNILNQTQRIRVYDPSKILPSSTKLNASVVKKHDNIDNTYKIEDVFSYDISLTDENGTALIMPLSKPVELLFEVVDGLDKNDLQAILVKEFEDVEFEEELVSLDGSNWLKIKTEHFSPYALIDVLTDEEEALDNSHEGESEALDKSDDESVNFVPTGDLETSSMIFYSSILLIMSLGILAKLNSKKKELKD